LKKSRGRPLGYRLSEESKRAISESKKGQRHTEATKEKISKTLMAYFKFMYPLSKELYDDYKEIIDRDEDIKSWFDTISPILDVSEDVVTEKSINSKRLREISIELNIDMSKNCNINAFTTNPEKMCELKMLCDDLNLNYKEILLILDPES
jgi:hypothetical protein